MLWFRMMMMMIVIPFGISSNIAERIIRNYDDGLFKHQMMITKEPACCQSAVEGPAGERRSFTSIYHTHDHHDYGLLFALFFHPTSAGYRLAGFAQYTEESKAKGLEGPPLLSDFFTVVPTNFLCLSFKNAASKYQML